MQPEPAISRDSQGPGCLKISLIILVTMLVTVVATYFILTRFIFPDRFTPVELSQSEQQVLDRKLSMFSGFSSQANTASSQDGEDLQPEKYQESDADRLIELSERELNSLLARNTDLAETLAIDLSRDLASGKLLVPLDPDFPIMGGQTLKITAGLELAYADGRPIVVLRGVSIMGVPIPNAWLGGLKNVDLVREFGDAGFWQAFAEGVEYIRVQDGQLVIRLKP